MVELCCVSRILCYHAAASKVAFSSPDNRLILVFPDTAIHKGPGVQGGSVTSDISMSPT